MRLQPLRLERTTNMKSVEEAAREMEEAVREMESALEKFNKACRTDKRLWARASAYCSGIIESQIRDEWGNQIFTMEDACIRMQELAEEEKVMEGAT